MIQIQHIIKDLPFLAGKMQNAGPKCITSDPLQKRLSQYGVSFYVPDWQKDRTVRSYVAAGASLEEAYARAGIGELLPPSHEARSCFLKVFQESRTAGNYTCSRIMDCMKEHVHQHLVVPDPRKVQEKDIRPIEAARLPVEAMIGPAEAQPLVEQRGDIVQKWESWVQVVRELVPDIPPPGAKISAGASPEWLSWIRTVAPLVPHIPTPEEVPGLVITPTISPPYSPIPTSPAYSPSVSPPYSPIPTSPASPPYSPPEKKPGLARLVLLLVGGLLLAPRDEGETR